MKITAYLVDAFTSTANKGNRTGVVLAANGLEDWQMQEIARIVGASETAFVLRGDGKTHDVHLRYFTPTCEVPICGHATIATHFLRALKENIPAGVLKSKAMHVTVDIETQRQHDNLRIVMTQGAPSLETPLPQETSLAICKALSVTEQDLVQNLPIQVASTGHSKVMVPLKDKRRLDTLKPDMKALAAISEAIKCNGFFTFALTPERQDILLAGRMFAPAIGIDEDPVTGNANGPAAFYLHTHGALKQAPLDGVFSYSALQGEAMDKPGIIDINLFLKNGAAEKVQIAGSAVLAGKIDFTFAERHVSHTFIQHLTPTL